jgi:homocysteine S-methyltransferase
MTLQEAVKGTLVLDGGLGSELERRGCDLSHELWSARVLLEEPERVAEVHQAYLSAGTQCISTASYQISSLGFCRAGLTMAQAEDALRMSVRLAMQVRDDYQTTHGRRALVAASIGPYGAVLADGSEFHGNYPLHLDDLVAFHAPRIAVLAEAEPDLFACETIPSLLESRALLESLHQTPKARAWFTFTCKDDRHVAHGEDLADCVREVVADPQVVAAGVNCTAPLWITGLLRALRSSTSKPIVVYPNSGRQWDPVARHWIGRSHLDPATMIPEWRREGAQWIGGCCGTTPEDIACIHRTLRAA